MVSERPLEDHVGQRDSSLALPQLNSGSSSTCGQEGWGAEWGWVDWVDFEIGRWRVGRGCKNSRQPKRMQFRLLNIACA